MRSQARSQRLPGPQTSVWSPGQPLVGAYCGRAALPTRAVSVPALPWKEAETNPLGEKGWPVLDAPPPAGFAVSADTRADGLFDSNLARGALHSRRQEDARAHSPGAVLLSYFHSIGTVRAASRDDNCGCWLHTRCAGSRQLLCGVHAKSVSGLLGSEAFHQAGAQSPGQRSDRLSMQNPLLVGHSQRQERCVVEQVEEPEQTRSCAQAAV